MMLFAEFFSTGWVIGVLPGILFGSSLEAFSVVELPEVEELAD